MQKLVFKRIAKFKFNGKYFQMFKTNKGMTAFLEIKDNKYYYPTENDFSDLVSFFSMGTDTYAFYNNGEHNKYRFIPKVKTSTGLVMVTSSLVLSILSGCGGTNQDYTVYASVYSSPSYDSPIVESPYDTEEENALLEGVTIQPNTDCYETEDFDIMKSSKYVQLYNDKYFTDLFGVENRSVDEVIGAIQNNSSLPETFKKYYIELVVELDKEFPGLDFRILYHNIQTLEFEMQDPEMISFDTDTVAYYDIENNRIVVSEDIDIENNIKDRLVFRHECGHPLNNLRTVKDGWTIKYSFNDVKKGRYANEAMNVVLTTTPFLDEYDTSESMGYPITTNIIKVIVESLPNYNYQDSISHNIYYFEKQLDEYFQGSIDASLALDLLELQWYEYSSNLIEVDEQEYIDLYRYVTQLYIKSNVSQDMSYEEIMNLERELEETLVSGVKDESLVYTNVVDEEFMSFIYEHGISETITK